MEPLVQEYRKIFTPEVLADVNETRKARLKIKELMSKSMPVDRGLLSMAVRNLPSPFTAQKERISVLCPQLKAS